MIGFETCFRKLLSTFSLCLLSLSFLWFTFQQDSFARTDWLDRRSWSAKSSAHCSVRSQVLLGGVPWRRHGGIDGHWRQCSQGKRCGLPTRQVVFQYDRVVDEKVELDLQQRRAVLTAKASLRYILVWFPTRTKWLCNTIWPMLPIDITVISVLNSGYAGLCDIPPSDCFQVLQQLVEMRRMRLLQHLMKPVEEETGHHIEWWH